MKPVHLLMLSASLLTSCAAWARPKSLGLDQARCHRLSGFKVAPALIGLSGGGATMTSATMVAGQGAGTDAVAEHCLVAGEIAPADPAAPDIRFQVALPVKWNGKVMMLGGAGYDGVIQPVTGNVPNAAPQSLSPLRRGYAVFASDGGHQTPGGSFTVQPEAYRNWLGDALKKTRDASMRVVEAAYGKAPVKSYFVGGSTGGREALTVAARWPKDWDGVVALYPARNVTVTILAMIAANQAFAAPGAYLNTAKRGILYRGALAACDGLDGVRDGIISNVRRCRAIFDPSTAMLDGKSLRCADGVEGGDACLSDRQIAALKKVDRPLAFNFPLANGQTRFPGYDSLISDNGVPSPAASQPMVSMLALGSVPPSYPVAPGMSLSVMLSFDFIRYAVTNDPAFNPLTLNVSDPGAYAPRLLELSAFDTADTDLSGFAAKGGKLLMMHGTEDLLVSSKATQLYLHRLEATMGVGTVDTFVRYYEVPGFGHSQAATFAAGWDEITALENWVENGADPATGQIVMDTMGVPGRTRPLCRYPSWPKYSGTGDVNAAASFTCARE